MECIWLCSGYIFKTHFINDSSSTDQIHYFYCCQDESRFRKSSPAKQQHKGKIVPYPGSSSLQHKPFLVEQTLNLKMHHSHRKSYKNFILSPEKIDFINTRLTTQTKSEIYHNLLTLRIPGVDPNAQYQIY